LLVEVVRILVGVTTGVADDHFGLFTHLADAGCIFLTTFLRHRREVHANLLALDHGIHAETGFFDCGFDRLKCAGIERLDQQLCWFRDADRGE